MSLNSMEVLKQPFWWPALHDKNEWKDADVGDGAGNPGKYELALHRILEEHYDSGRGS